jgi:hypothetical protein
MAQYDELERNEEFYEDLPESRYETNSFGERIEGEETPGQSDDLTDRNETDQTENEGPIDNLTDKAKDFGQDVKEKFE